MLIVDHTIVSSDDRMAHTHHVYTRYAHAWISVTRDNLNDACQTSWGTVPTKVNKSLTPIISSLDFPINTTWPSRNPCYVPGYHIHTHHCHDRGALNVGGAVMNVVMISSVKSLSRWSQRNNVQTYHKPGPRNKRMKSVPLTPSIDDVISDYFTKSREIRISGGDDW